MHRACILNTDLIGGTSQRRSKQVEGYTPLMDLRMQAQWYLLPKQSKRVVQYTTILAGPMGRE